MNKSAFLSLLTASLMLGSASAQPQTLALDAWADKYLPELTNRAKDCLSGAFDFQEVGALADAAVRAAMDLKGIFKGVERAKIAQSVFSMAARAALPEGVKHWVLPLLEGPAVRAIIEAAFLRVFGGEAAGAPPVVDAPEVQEGGIQ